MFNSSRYRILAIGKARKKWILEGTNSYLTRLPGLIINEIRDANPKKETEAILAAIKKDESLAVLSEEYKTLSSISFAHELNQRGSQRIVFVIGGPDGIPSQIKDIASWQFSLSPMTFPHDLARLLLTEQIYRAQTILQGNSYHRI